MTKTLLRRSNTHATPPTATYAGTEAPDLNTSVPNLSGRAIDADTLAGLTALLRLSTCRIKVLNLSGCALGDKGAIEIAEALEENTSVRMLNLDTNSIGVASTEAISRCIARNTTLIAFSLDKNLIGDPNEEENPSHWLRMGKRNKGSPAERQGGINTILSILEHNTTLRALSLAANPIGKDTWIASMNALTKNNRLKVVALCPGNSVDEVGMNMWINDFGKRCTVQEALEGLEKRLREEPDRPRDIFASTTAAAELFFQRKADKIQEHYSPKVEAQSDMPAKYSTNICLPPHTENLQATQSWQDRTGHSRTPTSRNPSCCAIS